MEKYKENKNRNLWILYGDSTAQKRLSGFKTRFLFWSEKKSLKKSLKCQFDLPVNWPT